MWLGSYCVIIVHIQLFTEYVTPMRDRELNWNIIKFFNNVDKKNGGRTKVKTLFRRQCCYTIVPL